MTEESIILNLAIWLDNRKFPYKIPRAFIYDWESDFWAMTAGGETREFEIKISRSDYLIDAKKKKHSDTTQGANYFYYVCPTGVIDKKDVDKKYGLLTIREGGYIDVVKKPQRLNDTKFTNWKMLANKMYWKWYSVWWEKKKDKEISHDEWRAGFNIQFDLIESEDITSKS
jgi:hypothetical protein